MKSKGRASVIKSYPPSVLDMASLKVDKSLSQTTVDLQYTDCVEISLLRLLQTIFLKNESEFQTIHMDKVKRLANDKIIKFFEVHNQLYTDSFYRIGQGYTLRFEWAIMLCQIENVIYNQPNNFEVRATMRNIITLFEWYLPHSQIRSSELPVDPPPSSTCTGPAPNLAFYQEKMDKLCEYVSEEGYVISVKIVVHKDTVLAANVKRQTMMDWLINGKVVFQLDVYEYFDFAGVRFGGHAELYQ